MSKWITFYEDILRNKISNCAIHDNKEEATKHFKNHYKQFFQLSQNIEVKLPMSYGYPHRKYRGMSVIKFKKVYGEEIYDEIVEYLKANAV